MTEPRKPEILAPAGDPVSLKAALDAGADAVYFGTDQLNMRHRARNFSADTLGETVSLIHSFGARAYVTLNTIIFENELQQIDTAVRNAAGAGADAVICWDFAAAEAAAKYGIEARLSTQASAANSAAILSYHRRFGIRRFVLARECTLEQIRLIRNKLDREPDGKNIELEVFIHGAVCVALSGRCFMSAHSTGESASRGRCLQPCRRKYRIIDVEGEYDFEIGQDYVMSPRDLCTMPFLEQIMTSGVSSLKIEGRMRSPEYVSVTVSAYRRAVDFYFRHLADPGHDAKERRAEFCQMKKQLTEELKTVFHRGFSNGFYLGRPAGDWTDSPGSQARRSKESVGIVENYFREVGAAEIRVQAAGFRTGDEILIQGNSTGSLSFTAESIQIEGQAVTKAEKGQNVALQVPRRVRRGDLVFRRFESGQRD